MITPGYAGFGQSTIPAGPLSLDALVPQVAAVIDDVGNGPVDLLGSSQKRVAQPRTAC